MSPGFFAGLVVLLMVAPKFSKLLKFNQGVMQQGK